MRLTRNFSDLEFECRDGTEVPSLLMPNLQRLCDTLQPIRDEAGTPLAILSGYRTRAWNERVGGAKGSKHMTAEAADVQPMRMTVRELADVILEMHRKGKLPGLGGLGIYRTWVHVDVAKATDGHLRRWSGKGIGSEPGEG